MPKALAVVGALPLLWHVGFALVQAWPRLTGADPCFVWGPSIALSAEARPCLHMEGTSQTKAGAIATLAIVEGGLLSAAVLALIGAFTGRRRLCATAIGIVFVISVPLLLSGLGMITLLCALCFLPSCEVGKWTRRSSFV